MGNLQECEKGCGGVSDCEELVGVNHWSECHFLKLNGTLEAQFDFV